MGVPYLYNVWLRRRYYSGVILKGLPNGRISSLAVDANGIIHKAAQIVYSYGEYYDEERAKLIQSLDAKVLESQFHEAVAALLYQLYTTILPQDTFIIAVDGVAPLPKIHQQRQRRYRARGDSEGKKDQTDQKDQKDQKVKSLFDSNAITPGTEVMARLDVYLRDWIKSYRGRLPTKVIYSSHLTPGEGEHIIMDLYRQGAVNVPSEATASTNPYRQGQEATLIHVLYGLDADLIMLSLLAPLKGIHLMREDIEEIVNVDALRASLTKDLLANLKDQNDQNDQKVKIYPIDDFVIMLNLVGNDFLPHGPSFIDMADSIDRMIAVYASLKKPLSQGSSGLINWPNLASFLTELAKLEESMLSREGKHKEVKYPSTAMKLATTNNGTGDKFDYATYRGAWYQNIFAFKGDPSLIGLVNKKEDFDFPTEADLKDICKSYLTALAWVFLYYRKGTSSVNFGYWYPYLYSPMLIDLSRVAKVYTPDEKEYSASENMIQYIAPHQLLCVLPPQSSDLLPIEIRHLAMPGSEIYDLFPSKFLIERNDVNAEWQGISLIPLADMRRVIVALSRTNVLKERLEKWISIENLVYVLSEEDKRIFAVQSKMREQEREASEEIKRRDYNRGRGRDRGRGSGRGFSTSVGRGSEMIEKNREDPRFSSNRGRGFTSNEGFTRGRGTRPQGSQDRGQGSQVRDQDRKEGQENRTKTSIQKIETERVKDATGSITTSTSKSISTTTTPTSTPSALQEQILSMFQVPGGM